MKTYDVIVIGLGAAGLFAIANLNRDLAVLGLERNSAAGLKLAISGGGRCNLSNDDDVKALVAAYTDPSFVRPIIYGFNNAKTVQYFEQNGLPLINENGRYYPQTQRAKDVIAFLLRQIDQRGHRLQFNQTVVAIDGTGRQLKLTTDSHTYYCKNLIVATGGATYPQTGSDGELLKNCFDISPFEAALCPIYPEVDWLKDVGGISLTVGIAYGKRNFQGDLLFTGESLTGPLIYNLSNYIEVGESFKIDFVVPLTRSALTETMRQIAQKSPKKMVKSAVIEAAKLPQRLVDVIVERLDLAAVKLADLKRQDLNKLIDLLKGMPLTVAAKAPLAKAIVSKGGIRTADIDNKTMQLKSDGRILVVGEAIELVGACGGYSLQFAFSSAYRAARHLNEHST